MQKTGIEWADYSWNPVTGCKHGCEYCYARKMAVRYKRSFEPTFPPEKLMDLSCHTRCLGVIFCGSNCDLFGKWVPDEWINNIMNRVLNYSDPHHTQMMFLTKNPARYAGIVDTIRDDPPRKWNGHNIWLGTSLDAGYKSTAPTVPDRLKAIAELDYPRKWVSIEPYLPVHAPWYEVWLNADPPMPKNWAGVQWVVFGVRTNPTTKLTERDIDHLWDIWMMLRKQGKSIFVKNSIVEQIWGTRQMMAPREFPAGVQLDTKRSGWAPKVKQP